MTLLHIPRVNWSVTPSHPLTVWLFGGLGLVLLAMIIRYIFSLGVCGFRSHKARGGWSVAFFFTNHGIILTYTNLWFCREYPAGNFKVGYKVTVY